MAKKYKVSILETSDGIEFIRLKKGRISRNFTPGLLDFSPLSWEEVKAFYKTNLHGRFVNLILRAVGKEKN